MPPVECSAVSCSVPPAGDEASPTIFGNSGGGIFHRETHEMIGISAMICTYDNLVSTPVPHLSIVVSLETVYDWLDEQGFGDLYASAGKGAAADVVQANY